MDRANKPPEFASWGEHMTPLSEFVKHHVPDSWERGQEYVVQQHAHSRFRIGIERNTDHTRMGFVLDRAEWMGENLNKWEADTDAEELAASLMTSLFHHMSVREYEAVIAELQAYVDEFRIRQAEFDASRKQPLVDMLTKPLPRSK